MNKLSLILPAAALLGMSGAAIAAPGQGRMPQGDMTRADAQARAQAAFAKMDANKDGKIDQADRAAMRDQRFARIDTNNDGQLSKSEFAAPGTKDRANRGKRMGMRGMGKNAEMTQTAFVERAMTMFDQADADSNGTVTQAERKAARETMRKQWQARKAARQQG